MNPPRFIIAGTHSGAGKTSVSLAVMAGLQRCGYRVQAYKVGPDYIDPGYHEIATRRPSHNLDDWMMGSAAVSGLFQETSRDCDAAVIEGVMGLFDGLNPTGDEGSTARIAKILNAPVILVVDAGGMARSVAAVIKGYQTLDDDVHIGGVILNRVASAHHFQILREAVERYNRCPVLGAVFRDDAIAIPERHLGLKPASENVEFLRCLETLTKFTELNPAENSPAIALRKLLDLTNVPPSQFSSRTSQAKMDFVACPGRNVRIAYARDPVFHFYYQANLDFLQRCGAELVPFSPLSDRDLPENIGGLYFGGGFPEVYADELENNFAMRDAVRRAVARGMPMYAECGGLMYLAEGIKTLDGKIYSMVGTVPGLIEMTSRLVDFGYCETELTRDCFLGQAGERFRGHEFHYSQWVGEGTDSIHRVEKKRRMSTRLEGYCSGNVLASYVHCHFLSYPRRALNLIMRARDFASMVGPQAQLK